MRVVRAPNLTGRRATPSHPPRKREPARRGRRRGVVVAIVVNFPSHKRGRAFIACGRQIGAQVQPRKDRLNEGEEGLICAGATSAEWWHAATTTGRAGGRASARGATK